jgi:hypothetical protein
MQQKSSERQIYPGKRNLVVDHGQLGVARQPRENRMKSEAHVSWLGRISSPQGFQHHFVYIASDMTLHCCKRPFGHFGGALSAYQF